MLFRVHVSITKKLTDPINAIQTGINFRKLQPACINGNIFCSCATFCLGISGLYPFFRCHCHKTKIAYNMFHTRKTMFA
jgi:hypothetical protein